MPKIAQFTMQETDSGRGEKTDILIMAAHVVMVKPIGTTYSQIYLSNNTEVRVLGNVEATFNKLIG